MQPKKASPTTSNRRHKSKADSLENGIACLTYKDPFASVYKKYIFSSDGKYLVGGMMIGDTSDYVKMVSLVKKKVCITRVFPIIA